MRSLTLIAGLVAAFCLAGPAAGRDAQSGASASAYEQSTTEEDLLAEDLASDPKEEVKAQLYTIAAKTTLPWHIHPDAQEIVYVLDGPFVVEVEKQDHSVERTELKTGDVFHLDPNAVHRGMNEHATDAAKLYVIRIKPKDAPLVEEVDEPQQ
ncbi:Cupin domain protein [Methyloligella halotolerans]|uniref:Cupin domain protein n=1 Tax=Methyloligella halotolerans TaxID=1177755 RepID=A0A1E2S108_9HYPH|nr:cupin domain-containing protein [Methyloligella halotolerans]ODA68167.1 Cupin domain protein [Methyloligella halotolerans]